MSNHLDRTAGSMETLTRDLRYVTRALVRTPGFFLVTVLTLALGIGATTDLQRREWCAAAAPAVSAL
jgi:hypothetical protein